MAIDRVRRALGTGLVVVVLMLAGACGGGGDAGDRPATPGANVDPNSGNVITDPINKAKDAADDAEARDAQIEKQGNEGYEP